MKRVLVFGSRGWPDQISVRRDMWNLHKIIGEYRVVDGFCPNSPDMIADNFALELDWPFPERHAAEWNTHGKLAGFIRNKEMADTYPDFAMGYILSVSNGSMDMRKHLAVNHIPTRITEIRIGGFAGFPELV